MRQLGNQRWGEFANGQMDKWTNQQITFLVFHTSRNTCDAIRNFIVILVMVWLFGGLDLALAQVVNEDFRSSADVFLRKLTSAEHQGMGGSFAGSASGANALNSNPAGLSFIDTNRFVTHVARFPRTVAVVAKLNEAERYEDHGQYDLRTSGLEFINYSVPLGKSGVIGFDLAFGHEGRFSRVNNLGIAINNFPENDFAAGIGYATKLYSGLSFGADAKWMRSKVQDTEEKENIGHGYAYNLGLIQQFGKHFCIGGVIRNLSNGLSFNNNSIPDEIHRDALIGGAYRFDYKKVGIQIGLDFNPPFDDGIRANLGGEIWYGDFIGARIGYLRHTEDRFDSIFILATEQIEFENRLWEVDGLTIGLGLRVDTINANAAYTPQMKPTENEGEQIRIEQGESVYSFSVGRGF